MGKDVENPSYKSLYVNETRRVFGIGTAVHSAPSSSSSSFKKVAIQAVRKKVGYRIHVRADANRNWTYKEAIQFGSSVKDLRSAVFRGIHSAKLEPVQNEGDIIGFCKESGSLVALDETIDSTREHPLDKLVKYTHPGIVATVIKPSVVGGFGNTAIIAQWAQQHQKNGCC
ncbi:protein PHYLLO, chloroplastic-like isoform X2 [Pyrus x bretschneideri]|uniref:protein PHYLLO, chloroplastic-like isoform X2 n=1 Tax=Pyrus x bretschneideri TaxID=225117 RepID=UPI00202FECF5|nr:protein PHYLLO, chloroplastic-like isoform X2 [Pyrus x bretschneideri]